MTRRSGATRAWGLVSILVLNACASDPQRTAGRRAVGAHEYALALKLLSGHDPESLRLRGQAWEGLGQLERARGLYLLAGELGSPSPALKADMARVALILGEFGAAYSLLTADYRRRILPQPQAVYLAALVQARIDSLLRAGKSADAERRLLAAVGVVPDKETYRRARTSCGLSPDRDRTPLATGAAYQSTPATATQPIPATATQPIPATATQPIPATASVKGACFRDWALSALWNHRRRALTIDCGTLRLGAALRRRGCAFAAKELARWAAKRRPLEWQWVAEELRASVEDFRLSGARHKRLQQSPAEAEQLLVRLVSLHTDRAEGALLGAQILADGGMGASAAVWAVRALGLSVNPRLCERVVRLLGRLGRWAAAQEALTLLESRVSPAISGRAEECRGYQALRKEIEYELRKQRKAPDAGRSLGSTSRPTS